MKKIVLITILCCAFSLNAQFRLVKDIRNGTSSSLPISFFEYNGRLFFSAYDDESTPSKRHIYATDGTNAGTVNIRLNTPNTGDLAHNPYPEVGFYEFNSELYFDVKEEITWGLATVVKLNGNSNTTSEVYALSIGTDDINSRFINAVSLNNKIIFNPITANGSRGGTEPYILDLITPSNSGMLKNVFPTAASSVPLDFTLFNNNIFFSAYGLESREIYKSDGTEAGTDLFYDINTDANGGSTPDQFNILVNKLTFVATHNTLGRELFKTTGNTGNLTLIKDINTSGDSNPASVTEIGGLLYFSADNGSVGQELWKSNGFNGSGTLLIKDINASGDSNPSKFFQFGTDIFFVADDGTNGIELWKTDGSNAGTMLVKNINSSGSSDPDYFTEYNGKLYFTANDGVNGTELWVTDGTTVGTTMIELNTNGDASVSSLIVFNNELFFTADDGVSGKGNELWAYKDPALGTNSFSLENQISLFPNPTKTHFEIQSKETIDKVEVYTILGQKLKSFTSENQYDISDLSKGVYVIKIQVKNTTISKHIMKE